MSDAGEQLFRLTPEWEERPPPADRGPVLVIALEGWVDAGLGASGAAAEILAESDAETVGEFDCEVLVDQRARRPIARIVNGVTEDLSWPALTVVATRDRIGAEILVMTGPEPDFRWPTFTRSVVELARRLDVRMVIGLGAFPAPAPHTRPVRLASTVPPTGAELAGRVGFVQGTIEVPAGVQSALELALGEAGIPVIGLWARVPHYVAAMPYPEASAALVDGLASVTGLVLDAGGLREQAEAARRQVDELISGNAEHAEMVRRLERSIDSEEGQPMGLGGAVPSGDEIAAELERFLRDEGG